MATEMKFTDNHNIAGYLMEPSAAYQEFKSMIAGLNTCRISHALRSNPVICKDVITDFWRNVEYTTPSANKAGSLNSTVRGVKVVITEQVIRDVMEFGDTADLPTEYSVAQVKKVLDRMGYEGTFPPTIKKLLPPYWRYLAHTFVSCISGRKGGTDEISQTVTTAIVALVMNWEYNFSKYVFDEMRSNIDGKKKDLFPMYPRFLQMIFNDRYPQIEKTSNTLDVKSLGLSTFGLMKQSRKSSKVVFQGKKPLEKFGKFAKIEGVQGTSVITAEVAEEHVATPRKFPVAIEEILDSDDEEAEKGEETEDDSVDEEHIAMIDAIIEEELNAEIEKIVPTEEQIEAAKVQSQLIDLDPPQLIIADISESVTESDKEVTDTGLLPRKRKRLDPRPGVVIREPTQATSVPAESVAATQGTESPVTEPTPMAQDEPSPGFEENPFGDDSSIQDTQAAGGLGVVKGKFKLPESELVDLIGLQERVFELERSNTEKDVLIGKLDIRVKDLENDNSAKDAKISTLEVSLGGLTAMFYDMKQRLVRKYGDEFKTAIDEVQSAQAAHQSTSSALPSSSAQVATSSGPKVTNSDLSITQRGQHMTNLST